MATERQSEDRRGFENFTGSGADQVLGVTGALRRDESNSVRSSDLYLQGELELAPTWLATLGAAQRAPAGRDAGPLPVQWRRLRHAELQLQQAGAGAALDCRRRG